MPFTAADCQRARHQIPALARRQGELPIAYLDGPAGSQMPAPVIDAISGYYREANANTHGQFATSLRSDELLQAVREKAAAFLGAESWRSISFGANMTTLTFALAHAVARGMLAGRRDRHHPARSRGQSRSLAGARRARPGDPRGGSAARRHPRRRQSQRSDRPAYAAGRDGARFQRPRHGLRRGSRPEVDSRRRGLAASRRGALRAPFRHRCRVPGCRFPAVFGLQVLWPTHRRSLQPSWAPRHAGDRSPVHAGPGRAVPDRDRDAESRRSRRRRRGDRLPGVVGPRRRSAPATARRDDRDRGVGGVSRPALLGRAAGDSGCHRARPGGRKRTPPRRRSPSP